MPCCCELSAWEARRADTKKITSMGTVDPIYTEGWFWQVFMGSWQAAWPALYSLEFDR